MKRKIEKIVWIFVEAAAIGSVLFGIPFGIGYFGNQLVENSRLTNIEAGGMTFMAIVITIEVISIVIKFVKFLCEKYGKGSSNWG